MPHPKVTQNEDVSSEIDADDDPMEQDNDTNSNRNDDEEDNGDNDNDPNELEDDASMMDGDSHDDPENDIENDNGLENGNVDNDDEEDNRNDDDVNNDDDDGDDNDDDDDDDNDGEEDGIDFDDEVNSFDGEGLGEHSELEEGDEGNAVGNEGDEGNDGDEGNEEDEGDGGKDSVDKVGPARNVSNNDKEEEGRSVELKISLEKDVKNVKNAKNVKNVKNTKSKSNKKSVTLPNFTTMPRLPTLPPGIHAQTFPMPSIAPGWSVRVVRKNWRVPWHGCHWNGLGDGGGDGVKSGKSGKSIKNGKSGKNSRFDYFYYSPDGWVFKHKLDVERFLNEKLDQIVWKRRRGERGERGEGGEGGEGLGGKRTKRNARNAGSSEKEKEKKEEKDNNNDRGDYATVTNNHATHANHATVTSMPHATGDYIWDSLLASARAAYVSATGSLPPPISSIPSIPSHPPQHSQHSQHLQYSQSNLKQRMPVYPNVHANIYPPDPQDPQDQLLTKIAQAYRTHLSKTSAQNKKVPKGFVRHLIDQLKRRCDFGGAVISVGMVLDRCRELEEEECEERERVRLEEMEEMQELEGIECEERKVEEKVEGKKKRKRKEMERSKEMGKKKKRVDKLIEMFQQLYDVIMAKCIVTVERSLESGASGGSSGSSEADGENGETVPHALHSVVLDAIIKQTKNEIMEMIEMEEMGEMGGMKELREPLESYNVDKNVILTFFENANLNWKDARVGRVQRLAAEYVYFTLPSIPCLASSSNSFKVSAAEKDSSSVDPSNGPVDETETKKKNATAINSVDSDDGDEAAPVASQSPKPNKSNTSTSNFDRRLFEAVKKFIRKSRRQICHTPAVPYGSYGSYGSSGPHASYGPSVTFPPPPQYPQQLQQTHHPQPPQPHPHPQHPTYPACPSHQIDKPLREMILSLLQRQTIHGRVTATKGLELAHLLLGALGLEEEVVQFVRLYKPKKGYGIGGISGISGINKTDAKATSATSAKETLQQLKHQKLQLLTTDWWNAFLQRNADYFQIVLHQAQQRVEFPEVQERLKGGFLQLFHEMGVEGAGAKSKLGRKGRMGKNGRNGPRFVHALFGSHGDQDPSAEFDCDLTQSPHTTHTTHATPKKLARPGVLQKIISTVKKEFQLPHVRVRRDTIISLHAKGRHLELPDKDYRELELMEVVVRRCHEWRERSEEQQEDGEMPEGVLTNIIHEAREELGMDDYEHVPCNQDDVQLCRFSNVFQTDGIRRMKMVDEILRQYAIEKAGSHANYMAACEAWKREQCHKSHESNGNHGTNGNTGNHGTNGNAVNKHKKNPRSSSLFLLKTVQTNEHRMPPGVLDQIIRDVQQELGAPHISVGTKTIISRYNRGEHLKIRNKDYSEMELMDKVMEKYSLARERSTARLLPVGMTDAMIEESRRELGWETFKDVPIQKRKVATHYYSHLLHPDATLRMKVLDEVLRRYAVEKGRGVSGYWDRAEKACQEQEEEEEDGQEGEEQDEKVSQEEKDHEDDDEMSLRESSIEKETITERKGSDKQGKKGKEKAKTSKSSSMKNQYLPPGRVDQIVAEVKEEMNLHHVYVNKKTIFRNYADGWHLRPPQDYSEMELMDAIVAKYAKEKERMSGPFPAGKLEELIQEVRKEMGMEHVNVSKHRIMERYNMNNITPETTNKRKLMEEILRRYASEKEKGSTVKISNEEENVEV